MKKQLFNFLLVISNISNFTNAPINNMHCGNITAKKVQPTIKFYIKIKLGKPELLICYYSL